MANYWVKSGTGGDDSGSSWDNAAELLATVIAIPPAVSEIIWVDDEHVDANAASTTWTAPVAATPQYPQQVICVSDFDASPGTQSTGAEINTSASYSITLAGNWWFEGVNFVPGKTSPGSASDIYLCGGVSGTQIQYYKNCSFVLPNNSGTQIILGALVLGTIDESLLILDSCSCSFANAGNGFAPKSIKVKINNLSHTGTVPTALFVSNASCNNFDIVVKNSDLNLVSTALVSVANGVGKIIFNKCLLHASVTPTTGTFSSPSFDVILVNCDSGDTNIRYSKTNYSGVITTDTGVYANTNPMTYNSQAYCLKMAASSLCSRFATLVSEWMDLPGTSSSTTINVECLVAGGVSALKESELWLEVEYTSASGSPLGTRVTTAPAQVIDVGNDIADGTITWTGDTGWDHKLTKTFTPGNVGAIRYRVCVGKPSTTIYVNCRQSFETETRFMSDGSFSGADFPGVGNVTEDDTVNGATGTYHEATEAEVQSGVTFGALSALTGTYVGGGGGGLIRHPGMNGGLNG